MVAKLDVLLPPALDEVGDLAAQIADAGVDGVFTYEGQTDVFFPLVVTACANVDLDLYTNIAVAIPRSPMHLAQQAWDLQRASQGRFALGLGSQIKAHIERRYGATWDRPVAQMAEIIEATRAIFTHWQTGEPLHFEGRWTTHTLMSPTLTPPPQEHGPPPIWAAALGPRMTEMAGRVADGLLVHPFTSRQNVAERNLPALHEGIGQAGRDSDDVTVVVGAICGIHEDGDVAGRDRALDVVQAMLGFYGSTPAYRPVLELHGWGDLQPRLREVTKRGDWPALGSLIGIEQVDTLAIVGPPEHVGTELAARFGDLADRVALSLPQQLDPALLARTVAAFHTAS